MNQRLLDAFPNSLEQRVADLPKTLPVRDIDYIGKLRANEQRFKRSAVQISAKLSPLERSDLKLKEVVLLDRPEYFTAWPKLC